MGCHCVTEPKKQRQSQGLLSMKKSDSSSNSKRKKCQGLKLKGNMFEGKKDEEADKSNILIDHNNHSQPTIKAESRIKKKALKNQQSCASTYEKNGVAKEQIIGKGKKTQHFLLILNRIQSKNKALEEELKKCKDEKDSLFKQCRLKSSRISTLAKAVHSEIYQDECGKVKSCQKAEVNEQHLIILFKYFKSSKILPQYQELEAVEMRQKIINMFSTSALSSQMLYAYDLLNPTDCHRYIQNKQNLLVLMKLQNSIILGAFVGKRKQSIYQQSFIFSISKSKVPLKLMAKNDIKMIDSKKKFLIFGNDQLVIKSKALELYSNLGSAQGIYALENEIINSQKFMQTKEKNVKMEMYQIHQIYFERRK